MTIKNVELHNATNNILNELTAQYLTNICKLYGHERPFEDEDMQTVYDMKADAIKRVQELGLTISNNKL
jgi:hypothetical protein